MVSKRIKSNLQWILIALFTIAEIPTVAYALPAFPGAEGWGSTTVGGRGGTVIKVTNTNNSGTGSLRAALTASGPRYVIFTTGGTITLSSDIFISNPYITVAGQTAPGDGIQVRGATIRIATHDVIIRGMRLRTGNYGNSNTDSLGIEGSSGWQAYNTIVDHNSLEWGPDEVANTYYPQRDITYSWNIIAQGLKAVGGKGYGLLIGEGVNPSNPTYHISIHHNLFAHNDDRNPLLKHDTRAEVINNLMYNWGNYGIYTYASSIWIKNYLKAGPNTSNCYGIGVANGGEAPSLQANSVYMSHNVGPTRPTDSGSEWDIACGSSSYQTTSLPFALSGVTQDDVGDVQTLVSAGAGATTPSRDFVDTAIVNSIAAGTGGMINTPADVGGWPTLATGSAPTDTDGDGMPDSWESAYGTNPNMDDHNGDLDGDGYLNIEEYMNSFFPASGARHTPNPPTGLQVQ